jgi:hypothetical protein
VAYNKHGCGAGGMHATSWLVALCTNSVSR